MPTRIAVDGSLAIPRPCARPVPRDSPEFGCWSCGVRTPSAAHDYCTWTREHDREPPYSHAVGRALQAFLAMASASSINEPKCLADERSRENQSVSPTEFKTAKAQQRDCLYQGHQVQSEQRARRGVARQERTAKALCRSRTIRSGAANELEVSEQAADIQCRVWHGAIVQIDERHSIPVEQDVIVLSDRHARPCSASARFVG